MLVSSSHTRAQALGGGGRQTALESLFALPGGVAHAGSSVEAWASEIQVTVSERLFLESTKPQRTDSPKDVARSHAPCFVAEGTFGPIRYAESYQFVAAVQGMQAQGSEADDVVIDDAQGDISLPACCETNGYRINGEKSMPRLAFIEGPQQVLLSGERGAVPDRHAFRRAPRHGSVGASARDIAEGLRQALRGGIAASSSEESEHDAEAIPDRHAYTRRGKTCATGHAALRCVARAFRRRASKPAAAPMSVLPSDESARRTGSVEQPRGASRLRALRWERSARFSR